MPILDSKFLRITGENPNMLVPWWLMAAYAYEIEDDPILSDGEWDALCIRLNRQWPNIEHRHKWIIDRAQLKTGTASYMTKEDYPALAVGALQSLRKESEVYDPRKARRERRRARKAARAAAAAA